LRFSKKLAESAVSSELQQTAGPQIDTAFTSYARQLQSWLRRAMAELQNRFDSQADAYRAQIARLIRVDELPADERVRMERDLEDLSSESVAV
jgi:hypothetical protein